ncbi:hypothetical protein [Candidatus Kurthia intestinigallinarum]|uniref:hypothetical protein n=1 Tax=Candidatus Kurthia intestinigallinarum TaxID=1562256 RepID=UPI000F8F2B53|nr:hypothetical protein [Kurthia sp. 3B1D]
MASRIKGITVEIGGDTTGLETALSDVNKQSKKLQDELKEVQRALKFDPGNTTLIAQQQQILSERIATTSQKLQQLKDAQSQVEAQFRSGQIGVEQYRAFQRELQTTEGQLNGLSSQLQRSQQQLQDLAQNTQQLETYFNATGTTVTDFAEVLGSKLTTAIQNGTASAAQIGQAITKIGQSAIGADVDIDRLRDALNQINTGGSIDQVNADLQQMRNELNPIPTVVDQVRASLQQVEDTSAGLTAELKQVQTALKLDPNNITLVTQQQDLLSQSIQQTEQKLDGLRQAQAQVEAAFASGDLGVSQYRAFQRELGQTEAQLSSLNASLQQSRSEQQAVASSTQQLNRFFEATGTSAAEFANVLGPRLSAAISQGRASSQQLQQALTAIGREALGAGADLDRFRSALIQAGNGGAADLQRLQRELQEIARQAEQTENAVEGIGDSLKSGIAGLAAGGGLAAAVQQALDVSSTNTKIDIMFDVPESSKASVRDAVKGIEAYGVDGEEALKGVQRQWALNGDASDKTNAQIVQGAGMIASAYADIDFNELIQESYEMGKSMGISQEEALGMTNALLKVGFPSEQLDIISEYGTQLKMAGYDAQEIQAIMAAGVDTGTWNIDNLLDGIKEGRIRMTEFGQEIPKSLGELLSKTDMSKEKFQQWGKDVAAGGKKGSQAMTEVSKWLSTIDDDTTRLALGTAIFGTMYEDQGANITETLTNASKATVDLSNNQKNLAKDVSTLNADPAVQLQKALNDVKTALTPLLTQVAQFVAKIANWVSENTSLVAALTAVGAIIGIVVAACMALAPVFSVIATVAGVVGASFAAIAAPVAIAIAAIAALVAAGVLIYSNWGAIKEFFANLWTSISTIFMTTVTAIGSFLSSAWSSIVAALTAVWNGIVVVAQTIWGLLTAYFTTVFNIYKTIFTTAWTVISTVLSTIWTGIVAVAQTIWGLLTAYFTTVFNVYKTIFTTAWTVISTVLTTIWTGIVSGASAIWSGLTSFFSSLWSGISSVFSSVWNAIKSTLTSIWNGLKSTASSVFNGLKSTITTIFNSIKSTATSVWNGIKSTLTSIWNGLKSTATSVFNGLKSTITTVFNAIKSTATSVWNGIKSSLTTVFNGIKTAATTAFNALKSTVTSVFNAIKSVATSVWNGIKSVVTSAVNGIKSVVTSVFNGIKSVVTSVMNGIKSVITSAWNGAKSVVTSAVNGIKSIVTSVFNSLKSVVSSAMNGVKSAIQNGWNAAKSFLTSINLVSIGKNIIQGLVNGIKSGVGAVGKAISEVAGNIKSKIKGALGIHSPSRWMRDEIGKNIDAGLAKGITAEKKAEQAAAKKAKAVKDQFTKDLKNVQLKFNAGKIDTKEYISQLNKLKSEYKNYSDGIKKIDVEINKANKKQIATIKSDYSARLKELKNNYNADLITNKQYIQALQQMKKDYGKKVKGSESELNAKIKELRDSAAADNLKRYEKQISNEEKYNNASLNKQIKFWEKRLNKFKKNSEEYLAVQDKITDLTFQKEAERLKKYEATYNDKVKYDGKTLEWEVRYWENRLDNFKKGSDEYLSIQTKLKDLRYQSEQKALEATETYLANIKKAEEDYVTNSTKLWDDYNKAVDDRTKSLISFAGLFDEITASEDTVTGEQLINNLQSQTSALEDWMNDIASLAARGLDDGLLQELEDLGPKSAQQIKALTSLSDDQLSQYTELWKTKSELARQQATKEFEGLRIDTEEQVQALRKDTNAQLKQYKKTWKSAMTAVVDVSSKELSKMTSVGSDAVQGLIDGMQYKKDELKKTIEEIANLISDTTKTELDIHSPSRVMRRLGEYTNEGFIVGLQRSAAKVQSAMQNVYGSLASSTDAVRQSSIVNTTNTTQSYDQSKSYNPSVTIINQSSTVSAQALAKKAAREQRKLAMEWGV